MPKGVTEHVPTTYSPSAAYNIIFSQNNHDDPIICSSKHSHWPVWFSTFIYTYTE